MKTKKCTKCQQVKPISEFYTTKVNGKLYPRAKCKKCTVEENYMYLIKRTGIKRSKYLTNDRSVA